MVALGVEDLFDDGVGVLSFVEEEEVRRDSRFGQCPDLEVVVMVEADGTGVGVLQVIPGFVGERQDQCGEFAVVAGVFKVAQSGTWWSVRTGSAEWQKRVMVRSVA